MYRSIFRACHARFVICAEKEKHLTQSKISDTYGGGRKLSWGRKDEEFVADFCLVSKRHLDEREYKVFSYFFLLGADWKACTQRLGMDRGTFFHIVTRIQNRLGRVFLELKPYALYPLEDYFGVNFRLEPSEVRSTVVEMPRKKDPAVQPPVQKAA